MFRKITILVLFMTVSVWGATVAQNSSINTFSPYTFYGLGDFAPQGTAYQLSMGGSGLAYRNGIMVNPLNPAALGNMGRKTMLFNFGMSGHNTYSKTLAGKTSNNTFNVRDVSLQMSLYEGIGLGVSINPLTNIGYRVELQETNPDVLANVGEVKYRYTGEGGITQFKLGVGGKIIDRVSLGAEMIYYHGNIDRTYYTLIASTIQPFAPSSVYGTASESISRMVFGFGIQASPLMTNKRILTLAATYRLGGKLNPDIENTITTSNMFGDTVVNNVTSGSNFKMPNTLSLGATYQTSKFAANIDYSCQNWEGSNVNDMINRVEYVNTTTLRAGMEYTPDRGNIRSWLKRLTYRVGFNTGNYYMKFQGEEIKQTAVSCGVGIPVKYGGFSAINLGAEYGRRGTSKGGLVKENFLRFFVGFSLFGEDYWFMKPKYD